MKTVTLYRIVKEKYSDGAFSGEGTELFGGRWNRKGKSCVYTAGSESLSILEMLVHLNEKAKTERYCLFELQIPGNNVLYLKHEKLPENWRTNPHLKETQDMGDSWLEDGKTLALAVPSAVVPREWIYILNPKHAGFERLAGKAKTLVFQFDPRL